MKKKKKKERDKVIAHNLQSRLQENAVAPGKSMHSNGRTAMASQLPVLKAENVKRLEGGKRKKRMRILFATYQHVVERAFEPSRLC